MKNDITLFEIKHLLKSFDKQNKIKTIVLICIGIAVIAAAAVFIVSKKKKNACPVSIDGLDYDDWDEFEDPDYDDYEFEDYDDVEYEAPEYNEEESE